MRICGPDAAQLVRSLTPRNLATLAIGKGRYVPICNHQGVLLNDPVLLPISDDEYWLSIADNDLILWVSAIAAERGFDVVVDEPDIAPLAVQGPKASNTVAALCGDWVRDLKHFAFCPHRLNLASGETEVIVARSGWSKQGGFELYLQEPEHGYALWDAVMEAGAPHDIGPGAPNYIERVESGLISMGADTDPQTNPYELGMGKLVDVDQEQDFIGKQALAEIRADGPSRTFLGFIIDGDPFPAANKGWWHLYSDGEYVGRVSAGAYSPRFKSNIGLGLVSVDFAEPGTELTVHTEFGTQNACVTQLPFTTEAF